MEDSEQKINWNNILNYFLYCFIGTIATIYIVVIERNEVVASSIVGIILSVFAITVQDESRFSWAGFAGSFAGMTSSLYISSVGSPATMRFFAAAIGLSLLVAFLYSLSEIVSVVYPGLFYDGYGGRLGMIAFISVLLYIVPGMIFFGKECSLFQFSLFEKLKNPFFFFTIPTAVIAALISMEIKNAVSSLNDNYKVLSVAITGMIGGILITKIPHIGRDLGYAWYTGAFVGMSSYFILMLKKHYFFAGLFSGVLYVLTIGLFCGVGGKLGFISFISVIIMKSLNSLFNYMKEKSSQNVIDSLSSGNVVSNISVDDNYAQKLVESLMKAKEDGVDITGNTDTIGDFVIGEKYDYNDYVSDVKNDLPNYESLNTQIKEMIEFIINLGISKWLYLQPGESSFIPFSYSNITDETAGKCIFSKNSKFISVLNKEKRIISFGKKGLSQPIFSERIAASDIDNAEYLIIVPVKEHEQLQSFFIIIDENRDIEILKNNMNLLKQYYTMI